MESANEEKNNAPAEQGAQQDKELNETWRALLGLQSSEQQPGETREGDLAAQVQPLAGDPWSHLIHTQGMQAVDLQKINLHDLYPTASDDDVERILNLMRESTGQLRALNEQDKGELL